MILSGALCGIAGFGIVSGIDMTISSSTARGFGFTAIIVAWLAKFEPAYMFIISFLLTFLDKGASQITSAYSVLNDYASQVITGIILFFILGSEFFVRYKIIFRGHHAVTAAAAAAASGTSSASKNEPARKDGDK
jgi:simple sugar transport system permease protein